jgi:hypothetical protein
MCSFVFVCFLPWLAGHKAQESDPMKLQTILEDYRAAVVALQGEIKTVRTQAGEQEKALRYLCCDMTNQVLQHTHM